MKNVKSEKGAITILVLVSVLFMVSFLISAYVIIANKVQTQKEIIADTKIVYESNLNMEETYNLYFSNDEIIPIYTVSQLLSIGTEKCITINGKIYTFSNDASYLLASDLEFSSTEDDWIPIGNIEKNGFTGYFNGNGHTITVTDLDGTTHIYSDKNSYGGLCNLTINTIPEDANVTLIFNEQQVNQNSVSVPYNTIVNYRVTKDGYLEQSDNIKITENKILEITLQEDIT